MKHFNLLFGMIICAICLSLTRKIFGFEESVILGLSMISAHVGEMWGNK